jgi:prepilin-type N-terminal cleavage/methylation domain-containing protein
MKDGGCIPVKVVAGKRAFTLAELLVASVVMTVALLGIHSLLFRAMDVEGRASVRWYANDSAEAVLDQFSRTLETAINFPSIQTLVIEAGVERDGSLICQTPSQRVRYCWQKDKSSGKYTLTRQTKPFAGSRDLTKDAVPEESKEGKEIWDTIPPVTVAQGLDAISVKVRPLVEDMPRKDLGYEGMVGKIAIELQVTVENQMRQRTIIPRCGANTQGDEEGDHG